MVGDIVSKQINILELFRNLMVVLILLTKTSSQISHLLSFPTALIQPHPINHSASSAASLIARASAFKSTG